MSAFPSTNSDLTYAAPVPMRPGTRKLPPWAEPLLEQHLLNLALTETIHPGYRKRIEACADAVNANFDEWAKTQYLAAANARIAELEAQVDELAQSRNVLQNGGY